MGKNGVGSKSSVVGSLANDTTQLGAGVTLFTSNQLKIHHMWESHSPPSIPTRPGPGGSLVVNEAPSSQPNQLIIHQIQQIQDWAMLASSSANFRSRGVLTFVPPATGCPSRRPYQPWRGCSENT